MLWSNPGKNDPFKQPVIKRIDVTSYNMQALIAKISRILFILEETMRTIKTLFHLSFVLLALTLLPQTVFAASSDGTA